MSVLDDPGTALAEPEITAKLENWAYIAAAAMAERHDELNESDESDDFKKDFKNEKKLRGLGARARRAYKMAQRMRQ